MKNLTEEIINKNNELEKIKIDFEKLKEEIKCLGAIYFLEKIRKNLVMTKKTYKNSVPKIQNQRKISFVNAISENLKLHYKNKINHYELKNGFNYNIKSIKSQKQKDIYKSLKRRKNKSQENIQKNKNRIEYINELGNFKSVEEIHFLFVQMNQKKKEFFENYSESSFN